MPVSEMWRVVVDDAKWIAARWYVPLLVLGALASAVLGGLVVRQLRRPDKVVKRELRAITAGEQAAARAVTHGEESAVRILERQHSATIDDLNERQTEKLDRLRGDPRALARWLTRLSD